MPKIEVESTGNIFPEFNEAQAKFVFSRYPFLLGSGGVGSGKTTALVCRALLLGVDSPWFGDCSGAEILLGRLKAKDFMDTTYHEIIRWFPKSWIKRIWVKDGKMELINGTRYHFAHLGGVEHLQSLNLSVVGIDQMEQVPKDVWDCLSLDRIRRKAYKRFRADGKTLIVPQFDKKTGDCISTDPEEIETIVPYHTAFGVCNPRHATWLKETFKDNEEYQYSDEMAVLEKYDPEFKYIHITVRENTHNLPGAYIDRQQKNKSAREFLRDVEGSWDAWEGKVFTGCERSVIAPHNLIPHPANDIYIGIDHGGTGEDKTMRTGVSAVTFISYQHRAGQQPIVTIFDELYLSASTIENTVAEIDRKLKYWHTAQLEHYPSQVYGLPGDGRLKIKSWRCDPAMNRMVEEKPYTQIQRYKYFADLRDMKMVLLPGDNDEQAGVEKVDWMFRKGVMKICPKCTNTSNEHAE